MYPINKTKKDLRILQERKAKYAGEPPLPLIHKIDDHHKAITLTQQAITSDLDYVTWETALKPLMVSAHLKPATNVYHHITLQHIDETTLTAAQSQLTTLPLNDIPPVSDLPLGRD